jgi:uncharacterized protein (TIGR02145 family)
MKKITLTILLLTAIVTIQAQNYQISFAGTGANTSVDSVKVENLSQCTSLVLIGTDTLNLLETVGINETGNSSDDPVTIYPNPSSGYCSVLFETTSGNTVQIGLYDMSGNMILQSDKVFPQGHHTFLLNGLEKGIYLLKIESGFDRYHTKLISYATTKGFPEIIFPELKTGSDNGSFFQVKMKNDIVPGSLIGMQFNAGDTLKLTGRSGNYRTVMTLVPDHSQTVTFPFNNCTDADSNHYAVVQIGSQLWMQENLKTTKYRDGSEIPNVADSAAWSILTTGAYCDYHNLPEEGEVYGHLYNYYAVADARNMCPFGWHVPSHGEWNIMEKFLDSTVDTTALMGTGTVIGRILKEGCTTRWQYMDTTYGLNSAGFSALCANFRNATGAWSQAPDDNHDDGFWTATSYNTNSAWYRSLRWCFSDIYSLFPMKKSGNSVRCIKDN